MKFNNKVEEEFYVFLLNYGWHRELTIRMYIHRLRLIKPLDELIKDDLEKLVLEYNNQEKPTLDGRALYFFNIFKQTKKE